MLEIERVQREESGRDKCSIERDQRVTQGNWRESTMQKGSEEKCEYSERLCAKRDARQHAIKSA